MNRIADGGSMERARRCVSCGTQLGTLSEGELLTVVRCTRCKGEICIACLVVDRSQPYCKKCYEIISSPEEPAQPDFDS